MFPDGYADGNEESTLSDSANRRVRPKRKAIVMTNRIRSMLAGALSALSLVGGCQTFNAETGMTLPSGHYLRHPPQYIPPSPPFPLTKELESLEEAAARSNTPRPAVPLPQ